MANANAAAHSWFHGAHAALQQLTTAAAAFKGPQPGNPATPARRGDEQQEGKSESGELRESRLDSKEWLAENRL
jgi:hypothetical protein